MLLVNMSLKRELDTLLDTELAGSRKKVFDGPKRGFIDGSGPRDDDGSRDRRTNGSRSK